MEQSSFKQATRVENPDAWEPKTVSSGKSQFLIRSTYCEPPGLDKLSTRVTAEALLKSLKDSRSRRGEEGKHEYEVNEKPQVLSCVSSPSDDTASTFSMSAATRSDSRMSERTEDDPVKVSESPPVQNRDGGDSYYGEYISRQARGGATTSLKMQKNALPQAKKDLTDPSPLYDRLAVQETASLTLRRANSDCKEVEVKVKVEEPVRLPSRGPSPLYERLSTHLTHATASKQSYKAETHVSTPFYTFVKSDSFNASQEVSSVSMLPDAYPVQRPHRTHVPTGATTLHERLATHHTHSSMHKKSPSVSKIRSPSPTPFYTLVTGTCFPCSDDVSAITRPSFKSPARTRPQPVDHSSHRNAATTLTPLRSSTVAMRKRSEARAQKGITRPVIPVPPRARSSSKSSPTMDAAALKGAKKPSRASRSATQDALFHRLSNQDTIASSRMKPLPVHGKLLSSYEKIQIVEDEMKTSRNTTPSREGNENVYDRLMKQGKASSLRKQMLVASTRYNSEHQTFSEGCQTGLMRKFVGSTFVRV